MIKVNDALTFDFDNLEIDSFWNVGNEKENKAHRIHSYPAKFPAFITQKAIEYARNSGIEVGSIADFFCGCGTVAYEAKRLGIDFWGCDLNPVAVLIAKTKSNNYSKSKIDEYYQMILHDYIQSIEGFSTPSHVNDRINYWFDSKEIKELSLLKRCIINSIPEKSKYYSFFLCAFSNILKPTSKWLTKSIKPQFDSDKKPANVLDAFEKQCNYMKSALVDTKYSSHKANSTIVCRNALSIKKKEFTDLIISSPPYVTSYEYADLHQLSTLWLDYVSDYRDLRKNSIGSTHSSYKKEILNKLNHSGKSIVEALLREDKSKARNVAKYYIDMQKITNICKNALKPEGMMMMVIGNTEYKGVHINNVKHLCESMTNSGFNEIFVTKRKISGKILTPYRDKNGKFSANKGDKKIYSEEFIVIGR